ncbi:MAG: hypothetical protein K0U12_06700 [Gammaproteobacteria bacterium]|nr:hypothetical protein [Gammaproteobacteria bacterium]
MSRAVKEEKSDREALDSVAARWVGCELAKISNTFKGDEELQAAWQKIRDQCHQYLTTGKEAFYLMWLSLLVDFDDEDVKSKFWQRLRQACNPERQKQSHIAAALSAYLAQLQAHFDSTDVKEISQWIYDQGSTAWGDWLNYFSKQGYTNWIEYLPVEVKCQWLKAEDFKGWMKQLSPRRLLHWAKLWPNTLSKAELAPCLELLTDYAERNKRSACPEQKDHHLALGELLVQLILTIRHLYRNDPMAAQIHYESLAELSEKTAWWGKPILWLALMHPWPADAEENYGTLYGWCLQHYPSLPVLLRGAGLNSRSWNAIYFRLLSTPNLSSRFEAAILADFTAQKEQFQKDRIILFGLPNEEGNRIGGPVLAKFVEEAGGRSLDILFPLLQIIRYRSDEFFIKTIEIVGVTIFQQHFHNFFKSHRYWILHFCAKYKRLETLQWFVETILGGPKAPLWPAAILTESLHDHQPESKKGIIAHHFSTISLDYVVTKGWEAASTCVQPTLFMDLAFGWGTVPEKLPAQHEKLFYLLQHCHAKTLRVIFRTQWQWIHKAWRYDKEYNLETHIKAGPTLLHLLLGEKKRVDGRLQYRFGLDFIQRVLRLGLSEEELSSQQKKYLYDFSINNSIYDMSKPGETFGVRGVCANWSRSCDENTSMPVEVLHQCYPFLVTRCHTGQGVDAFDVAFYRSDKEIISFFSQLMSREQFRNIFKNIDGYYDVRVFEIFYHLSDVLILKLLKRLGLEIFRAGVIAGDKREFLSTVVPIAEWPAKKAKPDKPYYNSREISAKEREILKNCILACWDLYKKGYYSADENILRSADAIEDPYYFLSKALPVFLETVCDRSISNEEFGLIHQQVKAVWSRALPDMAESDKKQTVVRLARSYWSLDRKDEIAELLQGVQSPVGIAPIDNLFLADTYYLWCRTSIKPSEYEHKKMTYQMMSSAEQAFLDEPNSVVGHKALGFLVIHYWGEIEERSEKEPAESKKVAQDEKDTGVEISVGQTQLSDGLVPNLPELYNNDEVTAGGNNWHEIAVKLKPNYQDHVAALEDWRKVVAIPQMPHSTQIVCSTDQRNTESGVGALTQFSFAKAPQNLVMRFALKYYDPVLKWGARFLTFVFLALGATLSATGIFSPLGFLFSAAAWKMAILNGLLEGGVGGGLTYLFKKKLKPCLTDYSLQYDVEVGRKPDSLPSSTDGSASPTPSRSRENSQESEEVEEAVRGLDEESEGEEEKENAVTLAL